jgi:hypothetical protein
MQRILTLLAIAGIPLQGFAQTVLHNDGGIIQINADASVYVAGNMTNDNGSSLTNNGQLTVTGSMTNNAVMSAPATGTLRLTGTIAQTFDGSVPYFAKDVEVNNPAGIVLTTPLKIDGSTAFMNGIIDASNAANPVIFTSNASISGTYPAGDQSHIKGFARREGTGAFSFPLGDGIRYQPVAVDLSTNSAGLTARYYTADAGTATFGTAGSEATPLLAYNVKEYWDLSPVGTANGTVTLNWDNYNNTGIGNVTDLRVAHKTAGGWMNEGAATVTGTTANGAITSNSVSTWSPFTLGSLSRATPLPLSLISFKGAAEGNANRLDWELAAGENVTAVNVERSTDGQHFQAIGTDIPVGSDRLGSFYDKAPPAGTAIYRLRMLNTTASSFSHSVSISRNDALAAALSLSPNPATSAIQLKSSVPGTVEILDLSGRLMQRQHIEGEARIGLENLPAAIYLIRFRAQNFSQTIRLVKH